MTHLIENMKLPAMIAVFGFMTLAVQVSPSASSGLTAWSVDVGVAQAVAGDDKNDSKDSKNSDDGKDSKNSDDGHDSNSMVCDCSCGATDTAVAEADDKFNKAKDEYEKASKAKSDHDNNGHGNNIDGVDSSNPGNSKAGEDTDSSYDDEKWKSENDDLKNKLDKAKKDYDDAKSSKDKADKSKSDDDKNKSESGACVCADGTTGSYRLASEPDICGDPTDPLDPVTTPPGYGVAPKAMRQIHGQ